MTHKVRTTMRPDQEIEVDDAEYLDLQQQGLLVKETAEEEVPPATAAPEPVPQPAAVAPKKPSTAGTKES